MQRHQNQGREGGGGGEGEGGEESLHFTINDSAQIVSIYC